MLHVHRAERTDRLVAALARVLAEPLDDPLATEIISVHSRGIERWIAQQVSHVLGTGELGGDGVCANVDFPFPSRLVHGAVAEATCVEPDRDPWLPERLVWPLLEVVDEHMGEEMLGPLRSHLGGTRADPDPERISRRFGAVRHIADLFDRYGVHRPAMVRRWQAGEDLGPADTPLPARHRWQPRLWRTVRERIHDHTGVVSFAERLGQATDALRADPECLDHAAYPQRLALFGLTALPASYLAVLEAIAAHREVHLLLLHPSPVLWERVSEVAGERGQRLWPRDADPTADVPDNPLLGSWGRDARELQLITPPVDDPAHLHHHVTEPGPPPDTLLGRIQADMSADHFPGRGDHQVPVLDPTDTSLQVHSCHGRLRQVEVLRDVILHLLEDDEDLEPRDIIVMCPDIEAFAPLVSAVFGAQVSRDGAEGHGAGDDGLPELRVRLADRSLRRTNPILEVVSLVLELADGRMTSAQVLDLATREPVRRRFDLDDEDLETLESWVGELGIRWGLDGAHRRRQGLPELEANTWRAGLERLQLGVAMADEDLRLVGGVAPFDDVEGRDSDLAGRLSELIARLAGAVGDMLAPQPVQDWQQAISAASDALTESAPDTRWQRLQLGRVLNDLVGESRVGETGDGGEPSRVELTLGEVRRLLDDRLRGRPSRTSHRTGDLTVCTLVPMRSVPHEVVCLLGMDDAVFPRRAVPDTDDLLQEAPRIGDRDARSEDRQLLLDAVLAATDTLVVTYTGRDERTNQPRPPAVPVGELLDVVDRTVQTDRADRPREVITTAHPLQAYAPTSYTPGEGGLRSDGRPFSFDADGLAAARAAAGVQQDPPDFLSEKLALPDEDTIELDDLVAFLQHPVKAFVQQRLEVSLPSEDERLQEAIPATLKGLDAWRVGEELLAAWHRGHDPDRAFEVARARGLVPPGDLGEADVAEVRERTERIQRLCERLDVQPQRRRTVDIEVDLPDGRTLVGTVPDVAGWQLQAISYSKLAAKHRLTTWVRLLAVSADDADRPWEALTAGRHTWKKSKARAALLAPLGDGPPGRRSTAVTQLDRLVDLYDRGRRAPIPLYCNSSLKSALQYRKGEDPRRYVHYEWESSDHLEWDREDRDPYHLLVLGGQLPTDALFEEACRDVDERSWADGDTRFVAYAWRLWEPILGHERTCET